MSAMIKTRLASVIDTSRDRLANTILIACMVVGLPTLLASMYRSVDTGWRPVFYIQLLFYLVTVATVLLRHRIPAIYKQLFICGAFFILGVSGLMTWGLIGMGETLLIVFVVVSAAFFGVKVGIMASILVLMIFSVVGAGFTNQWLTLQIDIEAYHNASSSWIANAVVITFFTGMALTALWSTERALKDSLHSEEKTEQLFKLVSDNVNDMVSIHDSRGKYIYVSSSCKNLLGYTEEELKEADAHQLIHGDDLEELARVHRKLLEEKNAVRVTYRIKRKDGEYIWFESIARHVVNSDIDKDVVLLIVSRDVTESILSRSELQAKQEQLRTITNALPNYIAEISPEGIFNYVNVAYENLTQMKREQIMGAKVEEVFTREAFTEINSCLEKTFKGEKTSFEKELNVVGNENRWIWARFIPMYEQEEKVRSVLMVIVDLTQQKAGEKDREELRRQLAQTQKMEAIGQLTGGIAHDFNNMLASIQGYAELLRKKGWSDDHKERYLASILISTRRGAEMIEKLLAFSSGRKKDLNQHSLKSIINEAVEMLASVIPSSVQINFTEDVKEDDIFGDAGGINQVIINLCINARDAMNSKGQLDISLTRQSIKKHKCHSCHKQFSGDYYILSVTDNGSGMDEESIEHIFEPFFSTKGVGEGSGMGLAMVHGIVHEHQGHVEVKSRKGEGSRFTVYLPVSDDGNEKVEENNSIQYSAENRSSEASIMLVDDDENIIDLISEVLQMSGYSVHAYTDSNIALQDVVNSHVQPDMVITDYTMPGMNGVELAHALWKEKTHLPVILMSAYNSDVGPGEALQEGFSAYLNKPSTTDEIIQTVEVVIKSLKS